MTTPVMITRGWRRRVLIIVVVRRSSARAHNRASAAVDASVAWSVTMRRAVMFVGATSLRAFTIAVTVSISWSRVSRSASFNSLIREKKCFKKEEKWLVWRKKCYRSRSRLSPRDDESPLELAWLLLMRTELEPFDMPVL